MAIRDKPQPPTTDEMLDKIRTKLTELESEIKESKAREASEKKMQETLLRQQREISTLRNKLETMSAMEIVASVVEASGVALVDRSGGVYDG